MKFLPFLLKQSFFSNKISNFAINFFLNLIFKFKVFEILNYILFNLTFNLIKIEWVHDLSNDLLSLKVFAVIGTNI